MKGIGIMTTNETLGVVQSDAKLVAESIHRLLNTLPFERPNEPYGCRVKELIFEPNDYIATTIGSYYISDAIQKFEPRVQVQSIVPSRVDNTLQYRIIFNLVNQPETFAVTVTIS